MSTSSKVALVLSFGTAGALIALAVGAAARSNPPAELLEVLAAILGATVGALAVYLGRPQVDQPPPDEGEPQLTSEYPTVELPPG